MIAKRVADKANGVAANGRRYPAPLEECFLRFTDEGVIFRWRCRTDTGDEFVGGRVVGFDQRSGVVLRAFCAVPGTRVRSFEAKTGENIFHGTNSEKRKNRRVIGRGMAHCANVDGAFPDRAKRLITRETFAAPHRGMA